MPEVLMVVGAIAGTVGAISSVTQANKAARLQRQQSELQNRRSQRQAFRESQIRRAQVLAGAGATGAQYGSGVAGGLGSLGSQLGETMGFSGQMSGLNNQISMASANSQTAGAFSKMGFGLFNVASGGQGISALSGLFPKQATSTGTHYFGGANS